MDLPVGFRLIDLGYSAAISSVDTPQDVKDIVDKFECQSYEVNDFFVGGGTLLNDHCRKLVKEIFSNDLKIDGFAYRYDATNFSACNSSKWYIFEKAFVMTSDTWITPKNVKFYTSLSTSELTSRTLIQTLFLKSYDDATETGVATPEIISLQIQRFLTQFPDSVVQGINDNLQRFDLHIPLPSSLRFKKHLYRS